MSFRFGFRGGTDTTSAHPPAVVTRDTYGPVERRGGADRSPTSATISSTAYAPGVGQVSVASGRVFADALSAAPVAGKLGFPVLLVDTDSIPASIDAELKRLKPSRIVIVGGNTSVSASVEAQLAAYTS